MLVVLSVSSVSILTRTIKLRTWLCSLKYYTNPCVHLLHADTESFIPDNTNNTIDNLGEYIYSKAYSQTKKQKQWSLWMVIFNTLEQYVKRHYANMDTGCSMKCSTIPGELLLNTSKSFVVCSISNLIRTIKLSTWPCPLKSFL